MTEGAGPRNWQIVWERMIMIWHQLTHPSFLFCSKLGFRITRDRGREKLEQQRASVFVVILSVDHSFLLTRCNNLPKMFSRWNFCKLVNKFSALKVEAESWSCSFGGWSSLKKIIGLGGGLDSKVAIGLWQFWPKCNFLSPQIEQFSMSRENPYQKMKSGVKEESHSGVRLLWESHKRTRRCTPHPLTLWREGGTLFRIRQSMSVYRSVKKLSKVFKIWSGGGVNWPKLLLTQSFKLIAGLRFILL